MTGRIAGAVVAVAVVVVLGGGCGGGDGVGGTAREQAEKAADAIKEQTGGDDTKVDAAAGKILCRELGAALPAMEARTDEDPENPSVGPVSELGHHWDDIKESKAADYEKILALQRSDPDAADAAMKKDCADTRDDVLAVTQQDDIWAVLASSLS